ncbi:MAG: hypothetical protein QOH70_1957 [Blastocatellia bacterium]|jgi:DNA-binding NtrC family response regulator|nr:hypothetical protein [Blastocatellia bacterium]
MSTKNRPRILIIDDLFGRTHPDRANADRESLCAHLLIKDITNDEAGKEKSVRVKDPIADAVFVRGLRPSGSIVGDFVEHDLEGTLQVVRAGWNSRPPGSLPWALVLLDLCFYTGQVTEASERDRKGLGMPTGREGDESPEQYFGLQILEALQKEMPELPVIILSAQPKEEVSREFTSRGGLAFLSRRDRKGSELLREYIRRYGLIPDDQEEIVGHSNALLLALRTARNAASTKLNVLMRGETGTGKELIARFLHRCAQEGNANRPFIVVNSAAIASSLWNSELFGIEKKIATGVDRKRGEIRSAHGGDLFFDEIGDMREDTQAGILRVLEDRKVKPVGTEQYVDVDVRFISATEKDIEAKAAIGSFRGALLQRLRQGGTVFLPALRERMEDVPILVKKFVEKAQDANPSAMKRTIEPETLDKIRSFDWPGNIRQLHDCIVEAVNNYLDVEHLFPIHIKFPESGSRSISYPASPLSPTESTPSYVPTSSRTINELIAEIDEFDFSQHPTDDLVGKLPALERAYARLSARYLEAALKANTKNRSAEKPEGDFSIKQAVETMTGSKVEGYVPRRMIEQVLKNEANRPILEKEDSILAAVARTLSDRKTKRDKTK